MLFGKIDQICATRYLDQKAVLNLKLFNKYTINTCPLNPLWIQPKEPRMTKKSKHMFFLTGTSRS
jgi:hypothetical protein